MYSAGDFCWVDLVTTDAAAAKDFYGEVFGWTASDASQPGHVYSMFSKDGKLVAGLGEMSAEMKAAGLPVVWNNYVATDDVKATAAKATELGGELMFPPQKGGDHGWLAFLKDPSGAVFALCQAAEGSTPSERGPEGFACWNELNTRSREDAESFYGPLFGWSFATAEVGPKMQYTTISSAGTSVGGMIVMDEKWGDVPPHWVTYFAAADVDAAHAKVLAAGGTSCVPPSDFPAGRFAMVGDPQGGMFVLVNMNH